MRLARVRGGATMVDILVAAAILGVGGIATMILMSQNSARTRRALEDFWAHRVAAADLGRHSPLNFGTLEGRFADATEARKYFKKTDPQAKDSGIPDALRDSMKIDRSMRFWRPSSMPQIGYLESTVTYVSADGAAREVRLSRLLVQPRFYSRSPLNAPAAGGAPPRRGADAVARGAEAGAALALAGAAAAGGAPGPGVRPGEPAEALDPDDPEDGEDAPRADFVDQVTEMVHDANHRGQLAADVHKIAKALRTTAAGGSGRYDWTRIGGSSFDPGYRLKLIDDVLTSVRIPDGTYTYTYREESFAVEHTPHPITIYDLAGADGATYLLARQSDREAKDAFRIENATAVDLGFHRVKPAPGARPGARAVWARVWATRTRVYAFATRHEPDGRLIPDVQQLTIRTLADPIEGTALPQCADPRVPGWVGGALDAIGVEPAATARPDSPYDLRQVLGA